MPFSAFVFSIFRAGRDKGTEERDIKMQSQFY